jgi:hypothetical protein
MRDHHRFLLKELLDEWKALGLRFHLHKPFGSGRAFLASTMAACSLVAEVGTNMAQFPSAHHLASWAAVCLGNKSECRQTNFWYYTRWQQMVAAKSMPGCLGCYPQKDCYLSAQFKRLAAKRGIKRAVMAVAHTILVIGYAMLKSGRSYQELGGGFGPDQQGSTPAVFRETTTTPWADGPLTTSGLSIFEGEW